MSVWAFAVFGILCVILSVLAAYGERKRRAIEVRRNPRWEAADHELPSRDVCEFMALFTQGRISELDEKFYPVTRHKFEVAESFF